MATKKEKKTISSYEKLENKYLTKMKALANQDKDIKHIRNSLMKGKNEYLRFDRLESASFDMEWIEKIEDCLPELGNIVNNPKKTIKTVTEVVPVELAKKTNAESLRHLSMNSQFVKSIDRKGNITPEKILNISSDDEYHTYENKFVATVIKRLVLFVEKRYEYLTKHAPFSATECLLIKNESVVDGSIVQIETKVKIQKSLNDKDVDISNSYLDRVDNIRTYLKYYLNSPFMKMFKAEKAVNGAIIMTNILRKNPDYHKVYELFKYISSYNKAGETYLIREEFQQFTKKHMEELNNTTLANFLAVSQTEKARKPLAKEKHYVPRILTSYDDDLFIFMPTVNNKPIEFIRVDEPYKNYMEAQLNKELKEKPTKEEFDYHEDDYKRRRKEQAKARAEEKLLLRKQKEQEKLAKQQELLREQERIAEEKRRLEEERLKELARQARLEAIRKEIRDQAIKDKKEEENAIRQAKQEKQKASV